MKATMFLLSVVLLGISISACFAETAAPTASPTSNIGTRIAQTQTSLAETTAPQTQAAITTQAASANLATAVAIALAETTTALQPTNTQPPSVTPTPTTTDTPIPLTPTPTPSHTPVPIIFHNILTQTGQLCLSIMDHLYDSPAAVKKDDCAKIQNQEWRLVAIDGRYSQIRVRHSGMCLDVDGNGSPNNGIIQHVCSGAISQAWRLEMREDGYFNIIGKSNGCVDVDAFNTNKGIQLIYFDCNGGENQLFTFWQ